MTSPSELKKIVPRCISYPVVISGDSILGTEAARWRERGLTVVEKQRGETLSRGAEGERQKEGGKGKET
jgi:hypothetical protein